MEKKCQGGLDARETPVASLNGKLAQAQDAGRAHLLFKSTVFSFIL